ncbi:hypothetical protein PG911_06420 [Tenacibaculum ovolyticum]|uniref:hypothetical protein n=1 Tax=Tenacibaculum ovolyticum TaxID=104270 RepID=UPI0022F3FE30|nr:hypothetical protein [Tenacibaculum ovolyticum]WBX77885.1 hypothetical protein PG911_06420 [Tenacibaculum ovolyticum]
MQKIYITLFITLSILSCKDKRNCTNADLFDKITVSGFGNLTKKSISFFRLDNQIEKIKIKSIEHQNNKNISGYGESTIVLKQPLFSQENYRLTIDDEKYDITDIKIKSEVRMIGMREDSVCIVDSFKLNEKIAKQIYYTSTITFHKPN